MRRKEGMVEDISELAGLSRNHPAMGLVMALFMFSLAGVPPLAGFFGKFFVFMAAINAGLYTLAVIGVVASVVGAFYYLRIVKIMYFDDPAEPFAKPFGPAMGVIMAVTGLFITLFFIFPGPVRESAQAAAAALIQ
jgi:NADH-quinone oxidoreductase subunit N